MDTMTLIKITINNRIKDIEKFSEETLVPHKKDE